MFLLKERAAQKAEAQQRKREASEKAAPESQALHRAPELAG